METSTKILFSNDDGYQFETALDEKKSAVEVKISRNSNTLFESKLSIATPIHKNSKAISNKTSTIFNNTNKAYYCSLSDADSHANSKAMVLGGLGVFYGFLGLVAAVPGMPFQFGLPIAAQGMMLAVGALADSALSGAGEPVRALLLPGRRISRTSENGMIWAASNAVTLTHMSIEKKETPFGYINVLFVKTANFNLEIGETDLSNILYSIQKWDILVELYLDSPKHIKIRSLVIIPEIQISIESTPQNAYRWGQNLCEKPSGTMLTWSSKADSEAYMLKPGESGPTLLVKESHASAFIERFDAPLNSYSEILSSKTNPQILIWVLKGYGKKPDRREQSPTQLDEAGTVAEAVEIIANHPTKYAAYTWDGPGAATPRVRGYTVAAEPTLEPKHSDNDHVFIIVCREEPFLRLAETQAR